MPLAERGPVAACRSRTSGKPCATRCRRAIEDTVLPRLLLTRGTATPRTDLDALVGATPSAWRMSNRSAPCWSSTTMSPPSAACRGTARPGRDAAAHLPRPAGPGGALARRGLGGRPVRLLAVTLGLMRLQQMVRDYGAALTRHVRPRTRDPAACCCRTRRGSSTASAAECWPTSSAARAGMSGTRRRARTAEFVDADAARELPGRRHLGRLRGPAGRDRRLHPHRCGKASATAARA